ncbi:MAG: copper-translocating P-type ATPase [Acidimicrobiia bacterium]|nr:copper-translocating P-type ATPase [Acidimicrobiia bacterium]
MATVHNLLGARLANRVLEPLWNSTHIEQVDVIWDETLALEGRAGYYDDAGAAPRPSSSADMPTDELQDYPAGLDRAVPAAEGPDTGQLRTSPPAITPSARRAVRARMSPMADHDHDGHHDQHTGHGDHGGHGGHGDHAEMFRLRFWWSLALTLPIVVTSPMVMDWFGYDLDLYGIEWVGPVLGTFLFLWGGWPFLEGGVQEAKDRRPGMMLLIATAVTVAFVASMATSLDWFELDFWWELAALITIMLLGHWQEMKALGQAQDALSALAALLPDEAEKVRDDGSVETIPAGDLALGDTVLVRSGARVPADGTIVDGSAELDESMITGESRPVARQPGDDVVAGTVSTDSAIRVEITAVGDDTALAGIGRLVAEAQESRSRSQALADRAAALLFYVAMGAAVITAIVWTLIDGADEAVVRVVTVLVISCPHALGLAIPLTTSLSSAIGARSGILIKNRLALEASRTVDAVLFDKTGTLTKGEHVVTGVVGDGRPEADVLRLAAAVESDSEHPLAMAIVRAAREHGDIAVATGFQSHTGRGVEATVDGVDHAVGGPALLAERHLDVPDALRGDIDGWVSRGSSVLYLIARDTVIGAIAVEDEIRPEARQAVDELRERGLRVVMITGDARQVAHAVATDLGLDEVFAEVLPEHKAAKVAELQARGLKVAMVGDGVNDAPALARADVGIAIGAGTDVAIESAGLILAGSDPRGVAASIRLSDATHRKSVQNLVWAAGYNVIAIPVAAGAFAWAGITMPPAIAAILMSASTIIVALNAQLLRRVQLR